MLGFARACKLFFRICRETRRRRLGGECLYDSGFASFVFEKAGLPAARDPDGEDTDT